MRPLRSLVFVLLASLGLLLASSTAHAYPPAPPGASTAATHLAALTVAAPHSMTGYSRDKFRHWDIQHGTCNTREVVLQRDGVDVTVDADCAPASGRWYSVYDAIWVDSAADVQIDHVVALADAWRSGADQWTDAKRESFANDLGSQQLIAVSGASNNAKSDHTPDEWKPSNTADWCMYARSWINVKYVWTLTVTSAEKTALADMLGRC